MVYFSLPILPPRLLLELPLLVGFLILLPEEAEEEEEPEEADEPYEVVGREEPEVPEELDEPRPETIERAEGAEEVGLAEVAEDEGAE